jgi:tetratricopeptide (TPR) repeat protein
MGRLDRSLDLARAALPHLKDRGARAGLLRDIATLAEVCAADRSHAARAWLDVLSLVPDDVVALEGAERLLRLMGDRDRLEALLACSAARESQPAARCRLLWRLAEFHRSERQMPFVALRFYREIVGSAGGAGAGAVGMEFTDEDWQRRDDLLAVHTARCLAAPTSAEAAQAIADRAVLLTDAGRLDDADRDLGRALDLDLTIPDVFRALERLYERRGDPRGLRQRFMARVEGATGAAAAHLWFGIGRAHEALGDLPAAVTAYEHACAADVGFRLPGTRLRQLALARGDFAEAARLLEREIALTGNPSERVALSVEFSVLLATKLNAGARAVEVLDAVAGSTPDHPGALEAMFGAALAAGAWEKATQALEGMLTAGLTPADTSERYHQLGLAAEKAGQLDRALGLYSRSYARNSAFRPTLERLSEICFERQQWDNAWKATEHLLERHGADLDSNTRADLALRSALADLHVAQRMVAATRIATMLPGPVSTSGLRDVADSWGSMRFEPRLLAKVDNDRRARVLARLAEVLALTNRNPGHMARSIARETLAALAVVDRRWADALSLLDSFGGDSAFDARRRSLFLACAGDVLSRQQGDAAGAALRYQHARALNPNEPRLASVGEVGTGQGVSAGSGVMGAGTEASDPRNRPSR